MRRQTCSCGAVEGKRAVLNSHARVGMTATVEDGIYRNKAGLYLKNNYCPQCGKPIEIVEDGQKKLLLEMEEIA